MHHADQCMVDLTPRPWPDAYMKRRVHVAIATLSQVIATAEFSNNQTEHLPNSGSDDAACLR